MKEKLDREKLMQVVGGSDKEMDELKAALLGNPHLKPIWDKYKAIYDDDFYATSWAVKEALELGFTASTGSSMNLYDYDVSHEQVLSELKRYPNL